MSVIGAVHFEILHVEICDSIPDLKIAFNIKIDRILRTGKKLFACVITFEKRKVQQVIDTALPNYIQISFFGKRLIVICLTAKL